MAEQKKQNLADSKVRKRFVTYKEAAELYLLLGLGYPVYKSAARVHAYKIPRI